MFPESSRSGLRDRLKRQLALVVIAHIPLEKSEQMTLTEFNEVEDLLKELMKDSQKESLSLPTISGVMGTARIS